MLSAYLAEIHGGVIQYTTSRALILATYEQVSRGVIPIHLPEETTIEEWAWWHSVLAPIGWTSRIERDGDSEYLHSLSLRMTINLLSPAIFL